MQLPFPLENPRIRIRSCTPADLPFICRMWQDEENGRYMNSPTDPYVDSHYLDLMAALPEDEDVYYCLVELADGTPVGTCSVYPDAGGALFDIGYCVHKNHWRQGIGTQVVQLLTQFARRQGAAKMTALVAKENTASNTLLRRLGFSAVAESSFSKYHMDITYPSWRYEKQL